MGKGTWDIFVVVLLAMLLPATAGAQEQDAGLAPDSVEGGQAVSELLAYEPTGNALWDVFSGAWLRHFAELAQAERVSAADFSDLPDGIIANWEDRFGGDPHFWQLRYWNALQHAKAEDGAAGDDPADFLRQGVENGAADAVTRMLLYAHDAAEFDDYWERYVADELAQDGSEPAPEIEEGVAPYSWYVAQMLDRADQLVADCPQESWAWYTRAMLRFKYGEWDAGLEDLRAGNAAKYNRLPEAWPVSFVVERARNGDQCGSELVAGRVAASWILQQLPDFIGIKDHAVEQQLRLSVGAPVDEVDVWLHYTCRLGEMEGAEAVQWLVALVVRNLLIKYLLVEMPEALTIEEREGLWRLYMRGLKVKDKVKYELEEARPDYEALELETDAIFSKHGFPAGMSSEEYLTDSAVRSIPALMAELIAANYRWDYKYLAAEYGGVYSDVLDVFAKLDAFDFDTFSWPVEE